MRRSLLPILSFLLLLNSCNTPVSGKSALLVIDMQNDAVNAGESMYNLESVIANVQLAITKFRTSNGLVVFVKYDGKKLGEFIPGTSGFELISQLEVQEDDVVIEKTANDSFYKSKLQEALSKANIDTVYICGTESDFCVNSTVESALSKDYKVTVLEDAHTASGKGGLTGEQIVRYYNSIWKMMIPTKNRIEVERVEQLQRSNI